VSKYTAIRDFLACSGRETVTVSFDELGAMVSGGLPRSAFEYDAWWRDASLDSSHVQSVSGWLAAGYRVESVNLASKRVTFRRTRSTLSDTVADSWAEPR
jgi:hypothetical protein